MIRVVLTAVVCASLLGSPAAAQVCRVIDPVFEPVPQRPEKQSGQEEELKRPENAEVARLLAEMGAARQGGDEREAGKERQEAVRVMTRWSKEEISRLQRSGNPAAKQGGPRMPGEVGDILHIGKLADELGVRHDAMATAGSVAVAYYDVRMKQLRTTGLEAAKQAQPHPPEEFGEVIRLEQEVASVATIDGRRWKRSRSTEPPPRSANRRCRCRHAPSR